MPSYFLETATPSNAFLPHPVETVARLLLQRREDRTVTSVMTYNNADAETSTERNRQVDCNVAVAPLVIGNNSPSIVQGQKNSLSGTFMQFPKIFTDSTGKRGDP